jgi:endonuclease G, mitochondrial
MKKLYFVFLVGLISLAGNLIDWRAAAQSELAVLASPHLVISQFQASGGSDNDEFIEIKNTSATPFDLNGYRLVYRSASGTNDVAITAWTTSTIVAPGGYYLVASTSYDGATTPDITFNNATCSCALSANGGGLGIRQGPVNTGTLIDSVAWGTATNEFREGTVTTVPGANNGKARNGSGCTDTDNNSADFSTTIPSAPRNALTSPVTCAGGGTTLFAAINANPTTLSPGQTSVITVTVIPATTPPSTGISVSGNFSSIGGSAAQVFFDNGTNGDVTAGDNVFSFAATIPGGTAGGTKNVTATASDAEARTANVNVNITVNAPLPNDDPLLFGNPSNATPDSANENNYLMQKPQYTLSYNRQKATPNWVAWRLDSSWLGTAQRQDDYRPDPALPAGWYQVVDADYSGSGYTRGHMTPSGDRTRSISDNSATFLMTNFVPQIADNNSGPWEEFETYCRNLANQGNEIYIFSGGLGSLGKIAQDRITVPEYTWKVVLILPNGDDDRSRVGKSTRAFGLIVPNFEPLDPNTPWRDFRVTVDKVEALTGYDFFSNLGAMTELLIEQRRDRL